MLKWLSKIGGDPSDREIKRLRPTLAQINALEEDYRALSAEELRDKTAQLRARFQEGESLDDLLPEAFAAVREAAWRTIGKRHYDEQMLAGAVLHSGRIAEMKTGEGKTLVATLPLYLNAIEGKGAHLVTPNDYLSRLGGGWMGPVYEALGLSVGVISHEFAAVYDPNFADPLKHPDERLNHWQPVPRRQADECELYWQHLRPTKHSADALPRQRAQGPVPVQSRRSVHRQPRRRNRHCRRVHRSADAGPPLFGGPAPGDRSQGGCPRPARERHAGAHHLPELLPHVREAVRHDRHRMDRAGGVPEDLRPGRGDRPDAQADGSGRPGGPGLQDRRRHIQRGHRGARRPEQHRPTRAGW